VTKNNVVSLKLCLKSKFAKNTDAFDVWNSTNVIIEDSVVYNQDDCIAVRCGKGSNLWLVNSIKVVL